MTKKRTNQVGELYCDEQPFGVKRCYPVRELRHSVRGVPYHAWRFMPRILDDLLNCVVYLYPSVYAAENGERIGGTGFLVAIPSEVEGFHLYAVTNSHVIKEGQSPVIRLNTLKGEIDILDKIPSDWIHHPDKDDLAVCPVDIRLEDFAFTAIIRENTFVKKEELPEMDIGVGSDIFMCGRFINHEGKQRNMPSVRFGNIAMMPDEPVQHFRGHLQESFLVEMRSLGGYSGSPVFVFRNLLFWLDEIKEFMHQPHLKFYFLGVDWGHLHTQERVRDVDGDPHPDGWQVKTNTGMATVIPAWRLSDLLDLEEFVMQRKKEDERRLAQKKKSEKESPVTADFHDETTLSRDTFEEALRRASRKISQPDEETKET